MFYVCDYFFFFNITTHNNACFNSAIFHTKFSVFKCTSGNTSLQHAANVHVLKCVAVNTLTKRKFTSVKDSNNTEE